MSRHLGKLTGGLAVTVVLAGLPLAAPAMAQSLPSVAGLTDAEPNSPLLLQADELVYDRDNQTVTAVGNVQVDYGGSRMVADKLIYDQRSGRLIAVGHVEILQPDGTRAFADKVDVTDDFRDGFVSALRVVTPDETRFAADSAVRENGAVTTFKNGVYTACAPCLEHPEKPPVWQIKAQRVIWNGEEKTIRFEGASFEFLGMPLASLPVFTTADPSVKRKTGFLVPSLRHSDEIGTGVSVPYFIALAPSYDLKLTATGLSRQGFLAEGIFRHRLENGTYTLSAAGIHQMTPDAFKADTQDATHVDRGMIGTTGDFDLNSRWTFGWDWMLQSDKNFARTYEISGFSERVRQNEVYLTGLHERNYFDLRAMEFTVQESSADGEGRDAMQPWVLPSFDYNRIASQPLAGGELSFNVNTRAIYRDELDQRGDGPETNFATQGLEGESARFTVDTEWKRTVIAPGGLALTPILAAQSDVTFVNNETLTDYSASGAGLTDDDSVQRWMLTAGLEARWPIMFTSGDSTHVIEPIAQVFVRPDEMNAGELPNEDAQSFVFDTTNLFDRDKFSGYDRIEGGTRANLGIRYTGSIGDDIALFGLIGQSYHLAGENSFASADMMNAGADSGLETDVSDIVASFGASYEDMFSAAVRGRFDEKNLDIRRAEAEFGYISEPLTATAGYAFIDAQPIYGYKMDRREVSGSASVRVADYWRVSGNATFDVTNQRLAESGIGLGYEDECFAFGLLWNQTRDSEDLKTTTIGFRLSFRTLGDLGNDLDGLGGF